MDVRILDASYRQAYAAIRSLGRAGATVAAVSCRSDADWAPGLRSRWCSSQAIVPDLEEGEGPFVDAIISLLDDSPARMVLPSHDGTIQALRGRRADLERRTFLPLASEAALDIATSKTRTLALAEELGITVPRSVIVTDSNDVRAALGEIGYPAVIKPASSWGELDGLGIRLNCQLVVSLEEAAQAVNHIAGAGLPALIQEWLPGRRDAVTLFSVGGKIWARFVQTSYREFPPLGGSSVFYESLPPLEDLVEPAEQLVRAAGLDGCSMVEFRRDRNDQPVLMEVNARLAGSVSLAISAGMDFPRLVYAWALGSPLQEIKAYRVGLRHRWLVGDLWNLKSTFESAGRPDHPSRGRALAGFFADFLRRPATWDGVYFNDLRPSWFELRHVILEPALERARKSISGVNTGVGGKPMAPSAVEVAIIGAGPYGLSVASHLAHRRITHRIFGFPMSSWRQMPPGMSLKSFGFATSIPTPKKHYTLPEYCRARGLEDFEPIATATFADYGDWFQQELVPYVERVRVTEVTKANESFELTLETGERLRARRVVVATGLGYFTKVPEVLSALPKDRITHGWHTSDYLKSAEYAGRDVTIIGSGQTALEAAALLHEGGATVRILARRDVWWSDRFVQRSLKDKLLNPNTVIGPGRKNWMIEHFPMYPYYMPTERRVPFVRTYLGPFGAWWLRDRVDGKVPVFRKTTIEKASMKNGRVRLNIRVDGEEREIETDHVISATGYEADVDRLPFLSRQLVADIERIERAPALSPSFESSVPGLYFIGPVAAFSFGPLVRFVAGANFAIPRMTRHLTNSLR